MWTCVEVWHNYGTDLTQRHTREWHALKFNPLSTKISSIHHRVWIDALVKYARRKHSQQALTEYLISNSQALCEEERSSQGKPSAIVLLM